uniref:Immunoglobulin domain-containing protein n=1 Tax=Scleropages formosus TaxID=113540 RepID=A0A8C9UYG6_SCLFO
YPLKVWLLWISAESGMSVTIRCHYDQKYKHHVKYWCKGYTWLHCTTIVRTDSPQSDVSITDDPNQLVFTVTMRNLQDKDSDTYWCAVEIGRGSDDGVYLQLLVKDHKVPLLFQSKQGNSNRVSSVTGVTSVSCFPRRVSVTSAKSNSHAENVRGTSVDDAVGHLDKPVQGSVLTRTVRLGPQTEQWTSGQVGLKMDRNKSQNDYVKHSFWSHSPSLTVKSQGAHPAEGQE